MSDVPSSYLQYRTKVTEDAKMVMSLAEVETPQLGPEEVLVRVEAAPINPSDLGLMVGPADLSSAVQSGTADRPVVTSDIPQPLMRAVGGRIGHDLQAGNEGAGTVVAAGESAAAQALIGKTVAVLNREMYAEYTKAHIAQCMELPDGISAREGASCYVNPLTALSFPETMRMEGHQGIVHTAAASNLGQMLVKICKADGVPLVNIVRKQEQEDLLRSIGAEHVVNSSSDTFMEDLIKALAATKATLAFDAIGGGSLAGQLLMAMEAAATIGQEYSRYGSDTHKQVYIYGRLDTSPTILSAGVGMAWGAGGYLLTPFLQKAGPEVRERMRQRVVSELKTTFASHYTAEISLQQALDVDTLKAYNAKATGTKYLINPSL